FAPDALRAIGAEVVELDCGLDFTFPNHNPNPEDMKMLHALRDAVLAAKADVGLAFDGDGDRCGVADNEGEEIFADKIGLFLARDFSAQHPNSTFVVDVKSTGLYQTDDVLRANGARIDYWKTGHSHMKRRVKELNALAGFEKSGHYFFNPPFGHGYDDGLVSALAVCRFLDNNPGKKMADLRRALPMTWGSPTMAPFCPDETKYGVVDKVSAHYVKLAADGGKLLGESIREVVTVNGVRVVLDDGTWGLVRASSNKPSLVVVVESPVSEQKMRDMFAEIDARLSTFPDIGEYDQKI
ncbi:MAG: phosphomannomutase/phosphoglucomutase, partial [Alphaproteobacteria bacterium]